MYEFEVKNNQLNGNLARDIAEFFQNNESQITHRSVLEWGEHCTECAIPQCYSTCDFYSPRSDGKCQRFLNGLKRYAVRNSFYGYVNEFTFKKWGKFWSPGNVRLFSTEKANKIEKLNFQVSSLIQILPFANVKISGSSVTGVFQNRRRNWSLNNTKFQDEQAPDYFMLEVYNPNSFSVDLTLEIRPNGEKSHMPYLKLLKTEGFKRFQIPFSEIHDIVDTTKPFGINITPNLQTENVTLYFGAMEFVCNKHSAEGKVDKPKKIKVVVWDLDNTLWDGILVEDGPENLKLKENVFSIIEELDNRGILLSIASKNNPSEAVEVLEKFKLNDYFLFPQISWEPKSQSIKKIVKRLNIGIDTVAFIDDSSFERAEVFEVCPEVMCIDAIKYQEILSYPEFILPKTADSAKRREFYKNQITREEIQSDFSGDYFSFLKNCSIKLQIKEFSENHLERIHELTQRTNQMNFSGNRYTKERLKEMLNDSELICIVLDCSDKFGSYGTVGFSVIQKSDIRMIDLMFSCRIQAKRVEHALFTYLLNLYKKDGAKVFRVNYRKTERNAPSGKVFDDFSFITESEVDGIFQLSYDLSREVPDDGVLKVAGFRL